MEELVANFTLSEPEEIKATFKIDITPTKVSQLENDLGFITKEEVELPDIDLSDLATKTELEEGLATKQPVGNYLTEHQDISHLALKTDIPDVSVYALKSDVDNVLAEIEQLLSEV